MSRCSDVAVDDLDDDELAAALAAGAVGAGWSEQAAVDLLVTTRTWLGRRELRQAVEVAAWHGDPMAAWVDWQAVDPTAPASSGELRLLHLMRSLGGVPTRIPLGELVGVLDASNLAKVLQAVRIAARGRDSAPNRSCHHESIGPW